MVEMPPKIFNWAVPVPSYPGNSTPHLHAVLGGNQQQQYQQQERRPPMDSRRLAANEGSEQPWLSSQPTGQLYFLRSIPPIQCEMEFGNIDNHSSYSPN
nr:hypothetical protein HmN_000285000 [Hymenolepis microstoma]CUU99899.1 hypothetical transcript [Hymenolepis microstoma]